MSKGSNIVPYNSSQNVIGTLIQSPANQSQVYENITRVKHEDKQSGSYQQFIAKERISTGNLHVERGSHHVGVKDEYTTSSTIRVGNKRGYTEYSCEERIRDVKFEDNNKQQKAIGGFKSDNDYGVSGGYGCDDSGEYECDAELENKEYGFDNGEDTGNGYYSDDDHGENYCGPGSSGDYDDDYY